MFVPVQAQKNYRQVMYDCLYDRLKMYCNRGSRPALLAAFLHPSYFFHLEKLVLPEPGEKSSDIARATSKLVKEWFDLVNESLAPPNPATNLTTKPAYLNSPDGKSGSSSHAKDFWNDRWNEAVRHLAAKSEKNFFLKEKYGNMSEFFDDVEKINQSDILKTMCDDSSQSVVMLKRTIQLIYSCPACGNVDVPSRNTLSEETFGKLVICHQFLRGYIASHNKKDVNGLILELCQAVCEFEYEDD